MPLQNGRLPPKTGGLIGLTGYSLHQAPETPDNTIHWPNADVMLGHCLRRLANIIPIKTLYGSITIFNHEHIFYLNTS